MSWLGLAISGALLLGIIFCHPIVACVTGWLSRWNAVEKEDEDEG